MLFKVDKQKQTKKEEEKTVNRCTKSTHSYIYSIDLFYWSILPHGQKQKRPNNHNESGKKLEPV